MSKEINRIMIDIETTGLRPGCHVLSIGAVFFNLDEGVSQDKRFYERIFFEHRFGLDTDPETMLWWKDQPKEVRDEAFGGTELPRNVIGRFLNFLLKGKDNGAERQLFSNHAQFDFPILEAYMEKFFLGDAWSHREINCYYTLANQIKRIAKPRFEGKKHNALDDAINQATHCVELLRFLN